MTFKLTVDKSGWEKIKKDFEQLALNEIEVGWFEGQNYGPDNYNLPYAYVAKIIEEGHVNGPTALFPGAVTPPRPYMRVGVPMAMNAGANKAQFQTIINALVKGESVLTAMESTLPVFEGTLRKVMEDWDTPANSPVTIRLKGFDNPLHNSGELIANVKAKVAKKGSD